MVTYYGALWLFPQNLIQWMQVASFNLIFQTAQAVYTIHIYLCRQRMMIPPGGLTLGFALHLVR